MESKSITPEIASFSLPLQDYQETLEFSLLKIDKSKMENLCFCSQAVTLELWMKQTQNLKGFLKLPGMVKQSKTSKGYYKLKDLDGNVLKLRVGIQHTNGFSSSSGIGSLCSLTNSETNFNHNQQLSTTEVSKKNNKVDAIYARNVKKMP